MAGERIHHPRLAELEAFLLGQLPSKEAARVVAHLLTGCASCRKQMEPLAGVVLTPNRIPEETTEVGSQYDFPLFRAFSSARRYASSLARERREAESDREDPPLREVPRTQPPNAASPAGRDWMRCEQILGNYRELRHSGPEAMVAATSLAVGLAEGISPSFRGSRQLADLQARARAERGNARRVADDLSGAETDLAAALRHTHQGTGDPLLLARLLDLTASLRTDQRRLKEASQLLDWAYCIYLELGERHEAGRALIGKSNAAFYALDLDEATRLLGQGLTLIDVRREPNLVLVVVHNLLFHLVEAGDIERAESLLRQSRELYETYGGRMERLKVRWMDGRIAFRLGDQTRAEEAFTEVRAGFEEINLSYDMALVSLELAAVWLEQGRTREIRELLDETVSTFQTRGIRREAIAALLMLREAFERERATAVLLRTVASELQRLEAEPGIA